jgi:glycosyltransferase involved in cell wall biosynthesis
MSRIAQINKYVTINGGSESVMNDLSILLTEKGHHVRSMGFLKANQKLVHNAIVLGKEKQKLFSMFNDSIIVKMAMQEIQKIEPDLIICHNIYHHFPVSQLLRSIDKKFKNVIKILYLHDYKPVCPIYTLMRDQKTCTTCKNKKFLMCTKFRCKNNSLLQSFFLSLDSFYNNRIFDFYSYFDKIIAPSVYLGNQLKEMGFPHKTEIIRNFLPKLKGNSEKKAVKTNKVIFAGRLCEEKGIHVLIECIKKMPQIEWEIIGDGPLKQNLTLQLEANKNVQLHGWKTREEVKTLLTEAKFMILPAVWNENCPLSLIEAFAVGLPVLGSSLGGIPELVGETRGFLFNPLDINSVVATVNKAMTIPDEQYFKMSENCRLFAEENSSDNYYNSLCKIIPLIR